MKILSKQNIYGMARVGFTGDSYEVYVNTDDAGYLPHFHYRMKDRWEDFHTCVRLDVAEYFHHGSKLGILNSHQKKELIRFLRSPVSLSRYKDRFQNHWELACFLWDTNNSQYVIAEDVEMPDYNQL